MTQISSAANLVSEVLQTINTKEIADESMRRTVEILLNSALRIPSPISPEKNRSRLPLAAF